MPLRVEGAEIRRMVAEWSPTCSRDVPERSSSTQRALTPGREGKGREFLTKEVNGGRAYPKVRGNEFSMRKGVGLGRGEVRA